MRTEDHFHMRCKDRHLFRSIVHIVHICNTSRVSQAAEHINLAKYTVLTAVRNGTLLH
jgi:hypothetical protein